jgi:hypothetical protein
LASEAIPLLHFPQHSTAAALELLAPLVRPQAVLHCQESRLFDDWPLAQESFPRVFGEFRRGLRQAPEPPLPVPDLGGLWGLRLEGLLGCRELAGIDAAVAEAAGAGAGEAAGENWVADPRSAFPFAGDEASGLARLRQYCLESDGLRHYKQRRNGLVGMAISGIDAAVWDAAAMEAARATRRGNEPPSTPPWRAPWPPVRPVSGRTAGEAMVAQASSKPSPGRVSAGGASAVMLFETMIEPETGEYLSEDYAFCRRWRDLGGEIFADFASRLTHVGHASYEGSLKDSFAKA